MPDTPPAIEPRIAKAFDDLPDAQRQRVAKVAKAMLDRKPAPPMKLTLKGDVLEVGMDCPDLEIATLLQMDDGAPLTATFTRA